MRKQRKPAAAPAPPAPIQVSPAEVELLKPYLGELEAHNRRSRELRSIVEDLVKVIAERAGVASGTPLLLDADKWVISVR